MRIGRFIGFLAMGLFLIIGCGKNTSTNSTVQEGKGSGSLIVHVADGNPSIKPLYTWEDSTGDTSAEDIKVARTSDLNTTVWEVQSNQATQNFLGSPWQQGTSSPNSTETITKETDLTINIPYRVTITKVDGSGNPVGSGYREFTVIK